MKLALTLIATLVLLITGATLWLAYRSQQPTSELGLVAGHLRNCPESPNCLCSEEGARDPAHHIAPIHGSDDTRWQQLVAAITQLGGTIITNDGDYLHATFTSPWLRFVDELEARRDRNNHQIHLRSASRVGHSDFGVNRKRLEALHQIIVPDRANP